MKNLIKLLCIIVLTLSVNSCGVGYQINSYNSNNADPIYDVEVIQTQSQLDWKLRTDWDFANNYYRFLQRQNYSFFQNQYYRNRLYRFGWNSPHDYWMNWQWNWHSPYNGYGGYWNSWNQYPYYGNWNGNYWWNYRNRPYGYSHIYGPRTQWLGNVYGRNSVYGRRLQTYRNLSNTNRRIVQQRNGRAHSSMIESTKRTTKPNRNTIVRPNNNTRPVINNRPNNNTKPVIIRNKPVNNTRPVINNRPPVIRNTSPRNNTRPTPTRTRSTTPVRTSKKRGGQ